MNDGTIHACIRLGKKSHFQHPGVDHAYGRLLLSRTRNLAYRHIGGNLRLDDSVSIRIGTRSGRWSGGQFSNSIETVA
jgi:hypothetical protein